MGQYWKTVNLTKREFIDQRKLGSGAKLWEQLMNKGTGQALIILLANMPVARGGGDLGPNHIIGRWAGDRVLMVGDYAEAGDFKTMPGEPSIDEVYELCREDTESPNQFTDITEHVMRVIENESQMRYIVDNWGGAELMNDKAIAEYKVDKGIEPRYYLEENPPKPLKKNPIPTGIAGDERSEAQGIAGDERSEAQGIAGDERSEAQGVAGMKIKPYTKFIQSHRTGTITSGTMKLTKHAFQKAIGGPTAPDDPTKVTAYWPATFDGKIVAAWDYKGSLRSGQLSAFGEHSVWEKFCAQHGFKYERGV